MLKILVVMGWCGIGPGAILFSQVAQGGTDLNPLITGGSVITVAGILYKVMSGQISRLQTEVDRLNGRLEAIADDDRQTMIPILTRAVAVLSKFAEPGKD